MRGGALATIILSFPGGAFRLRPSLERLFIQGRRLFYRLVRKRGSVLCRCTGKPRKALKMQEDRYDPARATAARDRHVVISGCSGGGKSAQLDELAARGYRTFPEPGREIIKEQTSIGRPDILDE